MTFDEIVESISFEEFAAIFLHGQLIRMSREGKDHPEDADLAQQEKKKIETFLSKIPEKLKREIEQKRFDVLFNIAYFARAVARMHPGWEEWDKNPDTRVAKEHFKEEVEKLYNQQKELIQNKQQVLSGAELLKALAIIGATTLKDNHFSIYQAEVSTDQHHTGWRPAYHPEMPIPTVGKNSSYEAQKLQEKGWDVFTQTFVHGHTEYPLMIAQKQKNGQMTGIVALSSCWYPLTSREKWKAILGQFYQKFPFWDNVIVDLRGNSGGQGFQAEGIVTALYGEKGPYCLEEKKRLTPEAHLREELFAPVTPQPRWDKKEHPFKGEQKGLYLLVDRHTASCGEGFLNMLSPYPGVQVIGENTCGCCQYGSVKPVLLPCGTGRLNIGTVYREYEDGMVECVGHQPDINCTGHNALGVALEEIENHQKGAFLAIKKHRLKSRLTKALCGASLDSYQK